MSSTAAVASSVNYHLPKQVNQDFGHREPSKTLPNSHTIHPAEDINYVASNSHVQLQPIQSGETVGPNDNAKLMSSNIDSALRISLKPWISGSKVTNITLQTSNAPELIQRSLNFHESSAPPLDSVIRQRIENHPKSLILCEPSSEKSTHPIKRSLCSDAELAGWCRSGSDQVPCQSLGLGNSGNTCYLNSVLQCLLATGPLLAYINAKHSNTNNCFVATGQMGPNKSRFCALCGILRLVREHNQRSQQNSARTQTFSFGQLLPSYFLANVRAVCPGFRPYQQEDAHEFLLGLLSRMEDSSTAGLGKLPRSVSETNAVRRIFGGIVRSEVTCHTCHNISARDEICFNLSVDITCGRSLQQCLFNYIHSEELCGQNAYKCEKCRQYRSATRRSTIFQGGPILIIQFNRFSRSQKLDTRVEFPSSFNLRPFMTDNKGPPVLYRLYATVNHEGYSCRSGHYVAFTRRHGTWLSHNDSFVNSTNVDHVLRQAPYLLFYEATNPVLTGSVPSSDSTSVNPQTQPLNGSVINGPVKPTTPTTSLAPNPASAMLTPSSVQATTTSHASPASVPVPVPSTILSGPQPPPPSTTVPRIVFNPNVKQRTSPTAAFIPTPSPLSTTASTRPLIVSPMKTNERTNTTTSVVPNAQSSTSESRPREMLSTQPTTAPLPFSSTTVRQLLYGDSSNPGLWSERTTPPVTSADRSRSRSSSNSNGRYARSADDRSSCSSHHTQKHSPTSSTFMPTPGKTSNSPESSVSATSHECDSTARDEQYTSSSINDPNRNKRRRRRSSESSSESSIVWVPNSKISNTERPSSAKYETQIQSQASKFHWDRSQWHADSRHHHHHNKKINGHRFHRDSDRRDRSQHHRRRHRHHQTDRERHRTDRRNEAYRHGHHRRTHDSHKTHNDIKRNKVFHGPPNLYRPA